MSFFVTEPNHFLMGSFLRWGGVCMSFFVNKPKEVYIILLSIDIPKMIMNSSQSHGTMHILLTLLNVAIKDLKYLLISIFFKDC